VIFAKVSRGIRAEGCSLRDDTCDRGLNLFHPVGGEGGALKGEYRSVSKYYSSVIESAGLVHISSAVL